MNKKCILKSSRLLYFSKNVIILWLYNFIVYRDEFDSLYHKSKKLIHCTDVCNSNCTDKYKYVIVKVNQTR